MRGPAGRVLQQGLEGAGIDPVGTYVTNVVKHFKWVPRGKRRLHQKPSAREIAACLPWLGREIELIRPQVLVLLGAAAPQALLGPQFRVTRRRGEVLETLLAAHAVASGAAVKLAQRRQGWAYGGQEVEPVVAAGHAREQCA